MAARWNYRCPLCGFLWENYIGAAPLTDPSRDPWCPKCVPWPLGGVRMRWIAEMPGVSLFSDSDAHGAGSFAKFTLPVEDPGSPTGFREETVASLADIRRLERESEQRERNGEGRRMVWRSYSQDDSNKDKHTLGEDPSLTPPKHYLNGQPVTIRRGDPVMADHGEQHEGPRSGPDTLQHAGLE